MPWDSLPWVVVVAVFGWNTWLHLQLRDLYVAKAQLSEKIESLSDPGTNGTILKAIEEIKLLQRTMSARIDADYHTITLCLIAMSRGDTITMADLQRKA